MWPFTKKEVKPTRDYLAEATAIQLEIARIKIEADQLWADADKRDPVALERLNDQMQELARKGRGLHLKMIQIVLDQQAGV